jgi:hypothetical protein
MTPSAPPRRVLVTYESTPSRDIYPRISDDLHRQLPLRNIHWKSSTRHIRTIQSLELKFSSFESVAAEQPQQMPVSLLERPYLHLLFVSCDVSNSIISYCSPD